MPEQTEDMIVRNLIEALSRLHHDLDRVELWTAALRCFQHAGAGIPARQRLSVADAQAAAALNSIVAQAAFSRPIAVDKRARSDAHFSRGIGRREASN